MYLRILNGIYTGNPTIFNAQLIQEVREVCINLLYYELQIIYFYQYFRQYINRIFSFSRYTYLMEHFLEGMISFEQILFFSSELTLL